MSGGSERGRSRRGRSGRIGRKAAEAFGFERLRPGQQRAIEAVLEGRDTLAVMPTGSGKSAIYQIAGLLKDGPTLVVSPLLALQRDQVETLTELAEESSGEAGTEAEALNSLLGRGEREELLERYEAGELEFLFLAPEQFASSGTLDRLKRSPPSLFVVDEAHCVAEWGHDFRPEYLKLGSAIEALGRPTVLALTATASEPVRDEIVERLGMRDPKIIVHGFDRPNLELIVERCRGEREKRERLVELVREEAKPGLVYAATRQHAEELAELLSGEGFRAAPYHAGFKRAERERAQEDFMEDRLDAIIATTAFGMGIDKPNVRFVFHYDIPGSLDSYYQQIGRAGRDGEPARAVLLYDHEDVDLQRFLNSGTTIEADVHERVATLLERAQEPVGAAELRDEAGLSSTRLQTVLNHLQEVGAVELDEEGRVASAPGAPDPSEAAQAAQGLQERHRTYERSRVDMMRGYAETDGCRRAYLLSYFGEAYEPPCGNCDRCRAGAGRAGTDQDLPFPVGSRVDHQRFGSGQVVRYDDGKVVVLFEEYGYQALALDIVKENGLLQPLAGGRDSSG